MKRSSDDITVKDQERASVRLMLHAIDGSIPFMTPDLLERCFPADSVQDVLSIGLAVRDTCVVPVFQDTKKKKQNPANKKSEKKIPRVDSNKPRGYTFSATVSPDPWLLPYERVTVPTFDLHDDAIKAAAGKSDDPVDVSSVVLPTAASHVYLWTSNGRHQITSQQYSESAKGLDSGSTVPLFESIPPVVVECSGNSVEALLHQKKRLKRKEAAVQRNQLWTSGMVLNKNKPEIWAPFAVSSDTKLDDASDKEHMSWISEKLKEGVIHALTLIGWQHIQTEDRRGEILESVGNHLRQHYFTANESPQPVGIAVLSTTSVSQILQMLAYSTTATGKVVIGTDLPAVWIT